MTTIYWRNPSSFTCMYGTTLQYSAPDRVKFENKMLPSSTTIYKWFSKVNYQAARESLQLPLLRSGQTYKLSWEMMTYPVNTAYFIIEFFDYTEMSIESMMMYENHQVFTYPKEAYYYTIKLVSSGCKELEFHSLAILPVEEKMTSFYDVSSIHHTNPYDKTLHIIFSETATDTVDLLSEYAKGIHNVIIVTSRLKDNHLYLEQACANLIYKKIKEVTFQYNTIKFIGYGPISNIAALFYQKKYPKTYAYITDDFLSHQVYQSLIGAYYQGELPTNLFGSRIIYYDNNQVNPVFTRLVDKKIQLLNLETALKNEE